MASVRLRREVVIGCGKAVMEQVVFFFLKGAAPPDISPLHTGGGISCVKERALGARWYKPASFGLSFVSPILFTSRVKRSMTLWLCHLFQRDMVCHWHISHTSCGDHQIHCCRILFFQFGKDNYFDICASQDCFLSTGQNKRDRYKLSYRFLFLRAIPAPPRSGSGVFPMRRLCYCLWLYWGHCF